MRWRDDIPESVKENRLKQLMDLYHDICAQDRQNLLGQEVEVLVDRCSRDGQLRGRTRCWKKVVFSGDASWMGTLQNVKVHGYTHQTLIGKRVVASPEHGARALA